MDETAAIACKRQHIYYVSFFTINAWGAFRPDIFIHEMMHIWQYQQLGAVYIPQALLAQRTELGYNYGGLPPLQEAMQADNGFAPFNLEQQADIVSDYFCLREGMMPRWCNVREQELMPVFKYFIKKLKQGEAR